MSLQTQILDIPLTGGLQELIDKRLVEPGSWLTLKNIRRPRAGGGFEKRYGTTTVSRNILGGSQSISACVAMGALDDTLLLVDATTIYSRSGNASAWIDRSTFATTAGVSVRVNPFPATLEHRALYGTQNRVITFDWCRTSDGLIHAAIELDVEGSANNSLYDIVFDESDWSIVSGPTLVDTNVRGPRVFVCGSNVVCVYSDGTNTIKARKKTSSTSAYSAATNLVTNQFVGVNARVFDAQPLSSTQFVLVYEDSANPNPVNVNKYNVATLALAVGVRLTTAAANFRALSCVPVQGEGIWVATSRSVGGFQNIQATKCNEATCVELFAPVTLTSGLVPVATFGAIDRLTIGRIDSSTAVVYGCFAESFIQQPLIVRNTITSGGVAGTERDLAGYQIASRPFAASDGRVYIWLKDVTWLDSWDDNNPGAFVANTVMAGSLYLLDCQVMSGDNGLGRVVARDAMRQLDNSVNSFVMSRVVTSPIVNSNDVHMPMPILRQLQTAQYPVERVKATWSDPKRHRFVQIGTTAYMQPCQTFDRNRLFEIGFHRIPDDCHITDFGAGTLSQGDYYYVSTIRHVTSTGEVCRSSPGAPSRITVAANRQTTVSCLYGSFTDRQIPELSAAIAQPEYMVVELWRTTANGQTFYLVAELPFTTTFTAGFLFTDNVSDATLIGKPILYTGSLLPNLSPPSLKSIVSWQNRLVGIDPNGKTLWISSEFVPGNQVTFNEAFNYTHPDFEVTALGVIDDKLIAFGEASAVVVDGQPADALGQNSTLLSRSISADLGCTDERGCVSTSVGIIFRTRRTFGLLSRKLEIKDIGASVQDEVAANPVCSSVTYVDRDREVRFTMRPSESATTGVVLVYNTTTGDWSTHEYYDSVAAQAACSIVASTIANGVWYASPSNGAVLKEDTSLWTDAGTYVECDFITPDIKVGGIAGFQRCRRVILQGERFTPHDLQVQVSKGGTDSYNQTTDWTDTVISAFSGLPIERVITHVGQQKSNSIRVRFRDRTPTGGGAIGTGRGLAFFGMSLELGVKKGHVGKTMAAEQKQ